MLVWRTFSGGDVGQHSSTDSGRQAWHRGRDRASLRLWRQKQTVHQRPPLAFAVRLFFSKMCNQSNPAHFSVVIGGVVIFQYTLPSLNLSQQTVLNGPSQTNRSCPLETTGYMWRKRRLRNRVSTLSFFFFSQFNLSRWTKKRIVFCEIVSMFSNMPSESESELLMSNV